VLQGSICYEKFAEYIITELLEKYVSAGIYGPSAPNTAIEIFCCQLLQRFSCFQLGGPVCKPTVITVPRQVTPHSRARPRDTVEIHQPIK
jgi:hypothetical protein